MRDETLYIDDILERIERIELYLQDDRSAFFTKLVVQDAVLQNLIVIGEAASNISFETRALAPNIAWRSIVGLRNQLIHGYTGIDLDETWRVIENDLPKLREDITSLHVALVKRQKND